jgi:hypothetical protein
MDNLNPASLTWWQSRPDVDVIEEDKVVKIAMVTREASDDMPMGVDYFSYGTSKSFQVPGGEEGGGGGGGDIGKFVDVNQTMVVEQNPPNWVCFNINPFHIS